MPTLGNTRGLVAVHARIESNMKWGRMPRGVRPHFWGWSEGQPTLTADQAAAVAAYWVLVVP